VIIVSQLHATEVKGINIFDKSTVFQKEQGE
jgi:hypothetical protein